MLANIFVMVSISWEKQRTEKWMAELRWNTKDNAAPSYQTTDICVEEVRDGWDFSFMAGYGWSILDGMGGMICANCECLYV